MSAPVRSEPRPKNKHREPETTGTQPAPRRIRSDELLPAGQPLHIEHQGELYILRRTSNGKLILTK